jgi:hypothetical protein
VAELGRAHGVQRRRQHGPRQLNNQHDLTFIVRLRLDEDGGATDEGGGATDEGGDATDEGGDATDEGGGATDEGGGATMVVGRAGTGKKVRVHDGAAIGPTIERMIGAGGSGSQCPAQT